MISRPSPFASGQAGLPHLLAALRQRDYRFTVVTPSTHRSVNARPENYWARSTEDVFGWNRPFTKDILDENLRAAADEAGVLISMGTGAWRSAVRAATLEDMLFLHSAFPTDEPDAVFFGPDTYRFANAVQHHLAFRKAPVRRVADIGCGSGAVGILLARAYPDAEIVLADINPAALQAAGANAQAAATAGVIFSHSDLFASLTGMFDLIVANPPYLLDHMGRTYRHGGGQWGEAISLRILRDSLRFLAPGGNLIVYTGTAISAQCDYFAEQAAAVLNGTGLVWHYREVDPDVFGEELAMGAYANVDRIAAVVLTVERAS